MFTSSPPGQPSAAFIKMNDPMGQNEALIREYVRQGYIVRTRADADLVEGIAGNTERCEAAFNSGAQYISTDFPSSGIPDTWLLCPVQKDMLPGAIR